MYLSNRSLGSRLKLLLSIYQFQEDTLVVSLYRIYPNRESPL
jgi:hypothetical protein